MSRPGTPVGVRLTPRSGSASPDPPHMTRSDSCISIAETAKSEQQRSGRDNIKVAVRIRPISEKEDGRGDHVAWATDGSGGVGLVSSANGSAEAKISVKYAYDQVFAASTTNEQVFEQVGRPSIEPVLCGISGTVFAYGVTSSGKTHTMMGTQGDPGVVPRAIQALFGQMGQDSDRVFSVTCSMLEIYCEMLNDLLDPAKLNLDVQERELPGGKGTVLQVKGLTATKVASAEAALALIQAGLDNRKVGATAYNDQSSRSHTLCRFLVEGAPATSRPGGTNAAAAAAGGSAATTRTSAWLTLVDLAGSEGAKAALSKDQAAEARDINRSLLTLGKVVYELAKGGEKGHVPFRDSLLTRLLKPSLTGVGAKVAIICNVTPASSQSEETWNTLRFADGAKRIKVSAVRNEALDVAALVAQYQREVESLKAQLAALTGAAAAGGGALSPQVLQAMQATFADTSHANQADQLADQQAQLRHLQESNSMAVRERDQLLAMNHKLVAILAGDAQRHAAAGPAGSAGDCAGAHAAALKRCLSAESLPFYGSWRSCTGGGKPLLGSQHEMQQLAGMGGLIRLTQDDVPDLVASAANSGSGASASATASSAEQEQQQQQQAATADAAAMSTGPAEPSATGGAAAAEPVIYFPGNRRTSKTLAMAPTPAAVPVPAGAVAVGWLAASRPARAAVGGCAAASAAAAAAAALGCSAVSQVVEVHQRQAAQEARLALLLQQLQDKEELVAEARQLQASQALQLRLTITAADRALLRDRLAEAEQQLVSYQAIVTSHEAEKEELYDTACSLFARVEQLTEANAASAAQLRQLRGQQVAVAAAAAGGHGGSIATAPALTNSSSSAAGAGGSPQHSVLDFGAGGSSSGRRSSIPGLGGASGGVAAAGAAAGGSCCSPPRPKSANAAFCRPPPSAAGAASSSGSVTPRVLSSIPSSSSSHSSNVAEAAAAALAGLVPLQPRNAASPPGPAVGLNNLNAICITSPFSVPAGQPGGAVNPALCSSNSLLSTGSRIPLPPCLQQRPSRIGGGGEGSAGGGSSILLHLANMPGGAGSGSRLPVGPGKAGAVCGGGGMMVLPESMAFPRS